MSRLKSRHAPAGVSTEVVRDIQNRLLDPLFMGIPLGATLSYVLVTNFWIGAGEWTVRSRWTDRLLRVKYLWRHAAPGTRRRRFPPAGFWSRGWPPRFVSTSWCCR